MSPTHLSQRLSVLFAAMLLAFKFFVTGSILLGSCTYRWKCLQGAIGSHGSGRQSEALVGLARLSRSRARCAARAGSRAALVV